MSSPARLLGELLAKGKVVLGSHASGTFPRKLGWHREGAPRWELCRFFGRVVEVTGGGARVGDATARLTVATRLVRAAQEQREPVAWITDVRMPFYPPDVAVHGVDLGALAVIRVRESVAVLRAADQLLRSGAFGLVVLDAAIADEVPLQIEIRLANLVKAHSAVLLWLRGRSQRGAGDGAAVGSQASLRAVSSRERVEGGRFRCMLSVCKDKRVGHGWEHGETFHGPVGLR